MATGKTFFTILYLLVYSCFGTAEINVSQVSQVEKGMTLSKELLQHVSDLAEFVLKKKEDTASDSLLKVLKTFSSLGKVAASFGFIGALISFSFAFIPQSDPMFEFMKEQFAEINRKLDSLSLQISTLQTEMEWTIYASSYGKDENVIRNSWAKLTEFIKTAPVASTQEQKTRLAERFTTFYENTGTENSVANFYRYINENNPVSLNKNLLQLIIEKSNGDFNVLVQYSTYFTTLMVSGLKLNVFYYKLKGYDAEAKAQEAVTQLSNTLSAIQDALIECADGFETWAYKDALKLSNQRFSSTEKLATDIKKHLESKFHWFKWIVIAHSNKDEFTFGHSINFDAQEKTSIHLIHQEKGSAVDQNAKASIQSSMEKVIIDSKITMQCLTMKEELLHRFGAKVTSHIRFLHAVKKPSDYAQTDMADIEMRCAPELFSFRDFSIFLKPNIVKPSCSDVNCKHGECKPIKDTTQGFCKCHKMFFGPDCGESIQNMIHYEALEDEINGITYQPVPDLTAIYFSVKELKDYTESVQHDIQWTQVFVKYSNVIQRFRYISTSFSHLKNSTITQDYFVSEAGALFTGGHSFQFYLKEFHHMMMGTGFGDKHNILEIFRKSLVQNLQSHSGEPVECTKGYSDQIDYFVRYLFALEKEAVLAWSQYLLVTGKSENTAFVKKFFQDYVSQQWKLFNKNGCGYLKAGNLQNNFCDDLYHSMKGYSEKINYFVRYLFDLLNEDVLAWSKSFLVTLKSEYTDFVMKFFQDYVSQQWKLFYKKVCGSLKPGVLQNNHCEKPYHSIAQQQVKLKCAGLYKPFPKIVVCSEGKWSPLPVCYTEQVNGQVECKSEGGATVCRASCSTGWGSATHPGPAEYKCLQPPCPAFIPHKCNNCTQNSVCKNNEVCTGFLGTCRDACLVNPCGVNTNCYSHNHDRTCKCVSPWKGDPYQGCKIQDLKWIRAEDAPTTFFGWLQPRWELFTFHMDLVSEEKIIGAVRSESGLEVCRAIGPDGGWHRGTVRDQHCHYQYGWGTHYAKGYEVLVDPCVGGGCVASGV